MCVICPDKVRPTLDVLRACFDSNPHGAGMSWRENGEVHWKKTNRVSEIYELSQSKPGEIVIHFRIASVGAVCDALRHPFPVSKRAGLASEGTAKAVLFQNGTWMSFHTYLEAARAKGFEIPKGEMSDARAAAFLVSVYGKNFLDRCGSSRWVHYGAKSTSLFGDWHRWNGMLFSNMYWRRSGGPLVVPKDEDCRPRRHPYDKIELPEDIEDQPKGTPPGATPKRTERELELWDMTAANQYWDRLARSCPKPVKKH